MYVRHLLYSGTPDTLGPIVFWPFCPLLRGCPLSEVKNIAIRTLGKSPFGTLKLVLCSEVMCPLFGVSFIDRRFHCNC